MSYRHPRWYDYGKTDADIERENNCLVVMVLGVLVGGFVLLCLALG